MNEEHNQSTAPESTAAEAAVTPAPAIETTSTNKSSWIKDLSIPISIMIAGAFVGAGIYFSGDKAPAAQTAVTPPANNPQSLIAATGIDEADFQACFESGRTQTLVQEDLDNAVATGGRGTPWSIVITDDGRKYPINGALPKSSVQQLIAAIQAGNDVSTGDIDVSQLDMIKPVDETDHIRGSLEAPIIIVEYSDFDCPFCSRFHQTMKEIVAESNGEVAWVYRHFPLEQLHPNAPAVAVASECVAELGGNEAFWTFADGYLAG